MLVVIDVHIILWTVYILSQIFKKKKKQKAKFTFDLEIVFLSGKEQLGTSMYNPPFPKALRCCAKCNDVIIFKDI